MKRLAVQLLLLSMSACSGAEPTTAKDSGKTIESAPVEAKPPTEQAKTEPTKTEPTKTEPATPEPTTPDAAIADAEIPAPEAREVAINPWASLPHTATWRLVAEPSEPLTLVGDLNAGVLGRAGSSWYQRGEDGQLAVITMDREPMPPILGSWPDDAWFVEERKDEELEKTFLRLMKLREGNRWVPQAYDGDQWIYPPGIKENTDHPELPHISTRSGMLVYSNEFKYITRVAGKHQDPDIGEHRGTVVDFVEAGSDDNVYVLSQEEGVYYALIFCEIGYPECVAEKTMKLPLTDWEFGRRVARGRHSVSVLARNGERDFILHHRGKSDGWLLDELPTGERPTGMWASEEGGLWTLTGERLRWRDTESVWHDVTLPEGLTGPSVALTTDRTEVWVSGQVAGAAKVFAATANAAPVAAPDPAPAP